MAINDSLGGTIGTDFDILVARSSNNGATWTSPAPLNTNAFSDSGDDFRPQVTSDGAGHSVAVWTSTDSLFGTIGTDRDILVCTLEQQRRDLDRPGAAQHLCAERRGY